MGRALAKGARLRRKNQIEIADVANRAIRVLQKNLAQARAQSRVVELEQTDITLTIPFDNQEAFIGTTPVWNDVFQNGHPVGEMWMALRAQP